MANNKRKSPGDSLSPAAEAWETNVAVSDGLSKRPDWEVVFFCPPVWPVSLHGRKWRCRWGRGTSTRPLISCHLIEKHFRKEIPSYHTTKRKQFFLLFFVSFPLLFSLKQHRFSPYPRFLSITKDPQNVPNRLSQNNAKNQKPSEIGRKSMAWKIKLQKTNSYLGRQIGRASCRERV